MMSLGNREDKAGSEAEPEELPDIGYLKQPAMDICTFLGISASFRQKMARRFYFNCNICMKYIYYSCILTSDKRNKDSLVRCFYENKFCPSMLKNYERKEEL